MINDNTNFLKLPLPHPDNLLEDDAPRLRDALTGVDVFAQTTDQRVTGAEQELTRKADASATDTALHALGGRVDQVAAELAGDISQLSGAVKTAHDKGVEALTLAESAEKDAQSALATCSIPDWSDGLNYVGRCMVWHDEKIWLWRVPSGPGVGGVKTPGVAGSAAHWLDYAATIAPVLQGGLIPAGHIAMLPFRYNELPTGWYFCNGLRYGNFSPQGIALKALPATLKYDWGINNDGSTTSVPNWFYGGRGPVMRAVDGSSRQVGSVELDALPEIAGVLGHVEYVTDTASGAFYVNGTALGIRSPDNNYLPCIRFAASRVVATASETRMLNRGMTPAIFLGV